MIQFDESVVEAVQQITGLSGDKLYYLTGTVYATVFLGKMPTKDDLVGYLGAGRRKINDALRDGIAQGFGSCLDPGPFAKWFRNRLPSSPKPSVSEVVYPLATELSLLGLYFGNDEEPAERMLARTVLGDFFYTQDVQTFEAFVGYNVVLEWLWSVVYGSTDSIDDFVSCRFETEVRVANKIKAFCEIVDRHNNAIHSSDYYSICDYLADETRRAQRRLIGKSGKITKERLIQLLGRAG